MGRARLSKLCLRCNCLESNNLAPFTGCLNPQIKLTGLTHSSMPQKLAFQFQLDFGGRSTPGTSVSKLQGWFLQWLSSFKLQGFIFLALQAHLQVGMATKVRMNFVQTANGTLQA
eukprot:1156484-Pelagomonas_calceolata.AAC.9